MTTKEKIRSLRNKIGYWMEGYARDMTRNPGLRENIAAALLAAYRRGRLDGRASTPLTQQNRGVAIKKTGDDQWTVVG